MAVHYGTGLKAKATKLHSVLVRQRGLCQRCFKVYGVTLQCAHIISRRYSNTRTLLDNAWCLCAGCHFTVDNFADAKMAMVDQTIGRKRYDELKLHALSTTKVDWEAEYARLKEVEAKAA